jgi:hypothetical protein
MKKVLAIAMLGISFPVVALADAYVKSAGFGGMGVNETWYAGKKKREETVVDMGGLKNREITITRVDKGIVWELDADLRIYRERPIYVPDTPGDRKSMELKNAPDEKWKNPPGEEINQCSLQLVTLPQKRVIAGFDATGYQAVCKEKNASDLPPMTMWISPLKGVVEKFDQETKSFDKAYRNELFKNIPFAERKLNEEAFEALGSAAGQMLLGLNMGKLPKGVPLKMEQEGERPDGTWGNMVIIEILDIRADAVNSGLFDIPSGYRKIANDEEYHHLKAKKMAKQMGIGGM